MRRLYRPLIRHHFQNHRQMLFLMGPRQVGKTTLGMSLKESLSGDFNYLNWDNLEHREILLGGPRAIATHIGLHKGRSTPPLLILDEIHKYSGWKTLLKGFFDTYAHSGEVHIVVTGGARLDVYRAGGDSLMGRYLRYRVHPFSYAELITSDPPEELYRPPSQLPQKGFSNLIQYGGFPEPLLKHDPKFYRQWRQLRLQQLFYEDVRDLTRIQEVKQMELLAALLSKQAGALMSYTSLAKKVRVSGETIRRWLHTLEDLYYCYPVRPWSKNVSRSLLKEPKYYLWDWSGVEGVGPRAENLVASHLYKACHYWTDRGEGKFELYFLRDKQKREVGFLVARDNEPWFLVEVKATNTDLSGQLDYFQKATGAKHAFQVVVEAEYQEIDCFSYTKPVVVPAETFLSQLV